MVRRGEHLKFSSGFPTESGDPGKALQWGRRNNTVVVRRGIGQHNVMQVFPSHSFIHSVIQCDREQQTPCPPVACIP